MLRCAAGGTVRVALDALLRADGGLRWLDLGGVVRKLGMNSILEDGPVGRRREEVVKAGSKQGE